MKRIIYAIMLSLTIFSVAGVCHAQAKYGDAVYSNITTYINHVPIRSYNYNGNTLIVAEDLRDYGFDVEWDEYTRSLSIKRGTSNEITADVVYSHTDEIGFSAFTVTSTSVSVFTENYQYSAYGGIEGYTLINVNDLVCIDNVKVTWNPDVRAVKVWVEDGLEMYPYMLRTVPAYWYYDYDEELDFYYAWDWMETPTSLAVNMSMYTYDGCYVLDEYGVLMITDVIDADGNSILKEQVWAKDTGMSEWPYVFGLSNNCLSNMVMLTADDIMPKQATEDSGFVEFLYGRYDSEPIYDSIHVAQLPYYKEI